MPGKPVWKTVLVIGIEVVAFVLMGWAVYTIGFLVMGLVMTTAYELGAAEGSNKHFEELADKLQIYDWKRSCLYGAGFAAEWVTNVLLLPYWLWLYSPRR